MCFFIKSKYCFPIKINYKKMIYIKLLFNFVLISLTLYFSLGLLKHELDEKDID